jgi:uncharacterized protein YjbI with pentapeptide repeats
MTFPVREMRAAEGSGTGSETRSSIELREDRKDVKEGLRSGNTFTCFVGRSIRLAAFVAILIPAWGVGQALAACTDPPGFEVNWQRCNLNGLDFARVDLREARLRDASFLRSNLAESDLSGSNAYRAKFVNADLTGAKLDAAYMLEADLTKAKLTGASMVGADLRQARFFDADLRGSDLTGARITGADLTRARLDGATWVDGERICGENSVGRCN